MTPTNPPETDAGQLLPWEKRASESPQAFEAFALYRDLGPERSHTQAAARLEKSRQLLSRWALEHDWAARTDAYDRHYDEARRAEKWRERGASDDQLTALGTRLLTLVDKRVTELEESPEPIKPAYLAGLAQTGAKLQRLGLGEATTISESRSQKVESIVAELEDPASTFKN